MTRSIREDIYEELLRAYKGGKGSGNFGHAGRPGKRGGSAPDKSSGGMAMGVDAPVKQSVLDEVYEHYGAPIEASSLDEGLELHEKMTGSDEFWISYWISDKGKVYLPTETRMFTHTSIAAAIIAGNLGGQDYSEDEKRRAVSVWNYNMAVDRGIESAFENRGWIRIMYVSDGYQKRCVIRTEMPATKATLRKIQRLFDDGYLPKTAKTISVTFSDMSHEIDFTYDEIMFADSFAVVGSTVMTREKSTSTKGGPGSGNIGHAGRPGLVGGSAPKNAHYTNGKTVYQSKSTKAYYQNKDGTWSPERQALHQKIIDSYFEGKHPSYNPETVFVGGGPAAGKTTLVRSGRAALPVDHIYVSADDIKERLPEYQEMVAGKRRDAARFTHEESSYIAKAVMERATNGGYSAVVDAIGDGGLKYLTKKIEGYASPGRKVSAIYVIVPVEVALKRVVDRYKKTGRFVPTAVVKKEYRGIARTLPRAIKNGVFGRIQVYDTSSGEPTLIGSGIGSELTIHNKELWGRFFTSGGD